MATPWLRRAGVTFTSLIDECNVLGKVFNLKSVPIGILLDEEGRLARSVGSVHIDHEPFLSEVTTWVETGKIPESWIAAPAHQPSTDVSNNIVEADVHFQHAIVHLRSGKRDAAIEELDRAYRLDPVNHIIRKQLWALEAPERFYADHVDYEWQHRRKAAEDVALAEHPGSPGTNL